METVNNFTYNYYSNNKHLAAHINLNYHNYLVVNF